MHRDGVKATLAVLESLTVPTTTPTSESILGLEEDLANTDTESVGSSKSPTTPSLTESSDIDPEFTAEGEKASEEISVLDGHSDGIADLEFWTSLVEDYSIIASKTPYLLTAKIRAGIPGRLRGILWQTMCQGRSTYLETMYNQLLLESSPYERIIMRDLPRTFPRLEMFKDENGIGQTRLFNVMKAYSIYDDGVGYCQGLGFLVGPLLMNMPECEAFCVFVRLMEDYDMRSMFTEKMEGLELRLYQLNSLLSSILPDLFRHFQEHGINTGMFASQWFLTLFAYSYPLQLVLRIFDIVFAEGAPETIMRISLALLKCNQDKLLAMEEFEDIIGFLSSHLFDTF
ncbi:RabGAP/TBC, partial [Basidiobolus meristosporus CBS 931.73]